MPRNYLKGVGKRRYAFYGLDQKEKAAEAYLKGKSLRAVEEEYGVPRATLNRFLNKKNLKKIGRPPVFDEKAEAVLTECIALAGDWGFPLTKLDIRYLVKAHLDRLQVKEPRFNNNLPGPDWAASYLKRNRGLLTQRLSQNIKRQRAAVDEVVIKKYFDALENSLLDVEPSMIVNYDETNLTDDPKRQKVIVRRSIRHPERILDNSKTSTSIMFSCAGDGTLLPVYVNYKAEHLYTTWTAGGPPGMLYNRTKSGWFTMETFEDWFRTVILPYFNNFDKAKTKVLIGDNLASHVSIWVLKKCVEENIRFVLLPPNSTGLTQPLDVAFFKPLKAHWSKVLTSWKLKNRGTIPKDTFPRLLKNCLEEMSSKSAVNIKAGFRGSGIIPLDRNQVLKRLPHVITVEENEKKGNDWVETFKIYLKGVRAQETQPKRQLKKKRLNIEPGASVSNTDLALYTSDSETQNTKCDKGKKKKPSKRTVSNSETSVSDEISLCDSDSDIDFIALEDPIACDPETSILKNIAINYQDQPTTSFTCKTSKKDNNCEISVGDFVVAKFLYNAETKRPVEKNYVGQVLTAVKDSHLLVRFMRKSAKSSNTFVFPLVEDEQLIIHENVITKIQALTINRGRHLFPKFITQYSCS